MVAAGLHKKLQCTVIQYNLAIPNCFCCYKHRIAIFHGEVDQKAIQNNKIESSTDVIILYSST